jgi:cell surface protein SprA
MPIRRKYVYNEIYSVSKNRSRKNNLKKNKFQIKGSFKSSGDVGGISIGQFNIPRGSVKVTAGGRLLPQEGLDYTVQLSSR